VSINPLYQHHSSPKSASPKGLAILSNACWQAFFEDGRLSRYTSQPRRFSFAELSEIIGFAIVDLDTDWFYMNWREWPVEITKFEKRYYKEPFKAKDRPKLNQEVVVVQAPRSLSLYGGGKLIKQGHFSIKELCQANQVQWIETDDTRPAPPLHLRSNWH
jgi:hypothetical protein